MENTKTAKSFVKPFLLGCLVGIIIGVVGIAIIAITSNNSNNAKTAANDNIQESTAPDIRKDLVSLTVDGETVEDSQYGTVLYEDMLYIPFGVLAEFGISPDLDSDRKVLNLTPPTWWGADETDSPKVQEDAITLTVDGELADTSRYGIINYGNTFYVPIGFAKSFGVTPDLDLDNKTLNLITPKWWNTATKDEQGEQPTEVKVEEPAPESKAPVAAVSGYEAIYDRYVRLLTEAAPNSSITEMAELANKGITEMAEYMLSAKGTDGQMATYNEWGKKLMDVYTELCR